MRNDLISKDILLSWQLFAYIVLIMVITMAACGKLDITNIKAGSFEMVLQNNAEKHGVSETSEFKNLKTLNESDLKLFLVMGGEEAKFYRFTNNRISSEATVDQYRKLQAAALMRIVEKNPDTTIVYPTEIGEKVHRALIQSIYTQISK
jgi:hypothetical protein